MAKEGVIAAHLLQFPIGNTPRLPNVGSTEKRIVLARLQAACAGGDAGIDAACGIGVCVVASARTQILFTHTGGSAVDP